MSKSWIINLIFLVIMSTGLVYAICTKNYLGIALMSFWVIFYMGALLYCLIEPKFKRKRLQQEAKKWFEQLGKEE